MFTRLKERNVHFLLVAFLLGLFIGINISLLATSQEPVHRYLDYFHRVYQLVRSEHVDVVSNKEMFYGAIRGMIDSLDDPYSRFLDEDAFEKLKEMTTGKFEGVGIEITMRDGKVIVITPIEDSPAMRAGVMAGDIIVKINDQKIEEEKLTEVVKMIKGIPGSTVNLLVQREGHDELIEFELERAPININSVEYTIIDEHDIGYVKIKNFSSSTEREVARALKNFKRKGVESLILDLRYNPGGLLDASIEISDFFLKKGKVIVSTKGREGSGNVHEYVSKSDPVYLGEIVVLVNRGSASAAEILSGAIRDNGRGRLVGEKTFGKGSVQKTYNLDSNIGVAITVAKYYTPSGRLIHKKGIKPDFDVSPEKIAEEDVKILKELNRRKLVDAFVTRETEYTPDTMKKFKQYLNENNISLSDKAVRFVLKNHIYRFKKKPLYDLEFDAQLNKAISLIKK